MYMCILMYMPSHHIYFTEENDQFVKELSESMSGYINRLIERERQTNNKKENDNAGSSNVRNQAHN